MAAAATPPYTPTLAIGLLEWLKHNVAEEFNRIRTLNNESCNDPESEPYRSLYSARECLTVIEDKLDSSSLPTDLKTSSSGFPCVPAHVQYQFGLNYIQTEEIGRGQECLQLVIDKYRDDPLATYPVMDCLNQLGILWANRGEHKQALELLLQAKVMYDNHKFNKPPLASEDVLLGVIREYSLREKSFESLHTHTLFYLAQVYGQLDQLKLSAEYCQETLSRQLETNEYDPIEWSLNAATISQYYIGVENFAQARHCLASARAVLSQVALEDTSPAINEKINRARADFSRCWIKYCLVLLNTSVETRNGNSNQENENEPLHKFEPLEVGDFEQEVKCELIEDYDSAKDVFLFAQNHIEISKAYFTLDDLASDHASVIQDHSRLFKLLSCFESDLALKCRINKRRIDILTAVVTEFNPQHFLPLIRQIEFEIAETYRDMLDLKIVLSSEGDGPPSPHSIKKINTLASQSITHFQKFVESFEEPIDPLHLRSYLLALLNIGRLHSKKIFMSLEEEINCVTKSLDAYKMIMDFKNKSGEEVEKVFAEELRICEEMVQLLPMKLNKLHGVAEDRQCGIMSVSKIAEERSLLPIFPAKNALIRQFRSNICSLVIGETGSGKTTQIPQYIYEGGLSVNGAIAVTQPRRVAAVGVATRVAQERGVELGKEVGYSVRFDDCTSSYTKIKYLTDGMLLREAMLDPLLTKYSTVILDEAHERTVNTDVLFGIVKKAQKGRKSGGHKGLRIIVMSATLEAEGFALYFNNARVLYINGRQYPVQLMYTPTPQPDYLHSAITTVLQIHGEEKGSGDILVFLTGQEEIETALKTLNQCRLLFPADWKDLIVCPLFAALPHHQQQKVFKVTPADCRKVILSTNVAETSITIPGVKYVIDSGMVKARGYNPLIGLDLLLVQPISKAQARQRSGRAGREMPGYCYRLYTEETFLSLPEQTLPEIQRCSLSNVVIQLLAIGIKDIAGFDYMDPPSEDSLVAALEELYLLGAIEKKNHICLTPLGLQMSRYPLNPTLAKAILSAVKQGCLSEVLSIVAMLSVESVLYSPNDKKDRVTEVQKKFHSEDGDHVMLLKIFKGYNAVRGNKGWCRDNFINGRNVLMATNVRHQLKEICERNGVVMTTAGNEYSETVRKTLLTGLLCNIAEHIGKGKYQTISSKQEVYIHPSSCLFNIRPAPQYVMYSELVRTTKCYLRTVSVINSDWLLEIAPQYFKA